MRMRAEVVCVYDDERASRAVATALAPDNKVPGGLEISTVPKGRRVINKIALDGRVETLLATLDDLLACTLTAENVI